MQTSSKQKLNMHMDFTCHGHLPIHRSPLVQVRNVLPGFFLLCPNAESVLKEGVKEQIVGYWTHVTQLPGIGKYAADAYAIFAAGKLQQVKPQDHKLVEYWKEVGEMLYRNS
uniref:Uncharacterized protein LOC105035777 isoform X2 n=1 Tax=Elaeis guineensis var. tenera TaxID=51953 RepID=A0A8N4IBK8_ELAGV|nr:uncharacterized protein LOC105035777 isoform X2 [Elaeis guineensis]